MTVEMELTFDFTAEMPTITRSGGGGAGRPAVEWEKLLQPARDKQGKTGRVFVFNDKEVNGKTVSAQMQAQGRVASVNARLRDVVPLEKWKFNIRKLSDTSVGVWVTFNGVMSDTEYAEYEKKRKERGDRIRAGRSKEKQDASPQPTASAEAIAKVKAARESKVVGPTTN